MAWGVRWYLVGSGILGVLGVLAGCSSGNIFVEREPWRHEAEAQCLSAGGVKESAGLVRIKPINGPGMCGADFPLKVTLLAESSALGYSDEIGMRPPGGIPNAASQPRWPAASPPPSSAPVSNQSLPPIPESYYEPPPPPGYRPPARGDQPVSLDPPTRSGQGTPPELYDFRRPYGSTRPAPPPPPARSPVSARALDPRALDPSAPPVDFSPVPYERRQVLGEPVQRFEPPPSEPSRAPVRTSPMARPLPVPPREPPKPLPALGPSRAPLTTGAVAVSPAATLACPIVSALDQWLAGAVQPAAMHWFGQPVVEIKQISAYSCRGMNGDPNAHISEHAFGNALDIAVFVLADGRKIVVEKGWHGAPEEQGFLRDVQGAACDQFTTVLAPGSNVYHYNHIHVDLMRRRGGRRACNPKPVSGEEIAARAGGRFAAKRSADASVTGSIAPRRLQPPPTKLATRPEPKEKRALPFAVPGEDGDDDDEE